MIKIEKGIAKLAREAIRDLSNAQPNESMTEQLEVLRDLVDVYESTQRSLERLETWRTLSERPDEGEPVVVRFSHDGDEYFRVSTYSDGVFCPLDEGEIINWAHIAEWDPVFTEGEADES